MGLALVRARGYALDTDFSYLTLTDTTVVFPKTTVAEDPRYLLGLLNTKLLTFRFRGLGKLTSPGMWESFDNSIRELPIRRIDFADQTDRRAHDDVVRIVGDLERTASTIRSATSTTERSIASRRSEGLKDQLEEITLDLYGIADPDDRAEVVHRGAVLDQERPERNSGAPRLWPKCRPAKEPCDNPRVAKAV